ncbi:MAG: hypothetical protein JWM36_4227 [Hyphomicrobiales bacterium]|nr:hypothetical protein [Hyphomicrobiales bacterium]
MAIPFNRRMWEISENLHRAELSALERAENIAEWVRLSGRLPSHSETVGHRPKGGINNAARELGLDRASAHRAVKVDSLTPEAKDAAALSRDFESYVCGSVAFSSRFVRRWWPWAPTFARLCRISPEIRGRDYRHADPRCLSGSGCMRQTARSLRSVTEAEASRFSALLGAGTNVVHSLVSACNTTMRPLSSARQRKVSRIALLEQRLRQTWKPLPRLQQPCEFPQRSSR